VETLPKPENEARLIKLLTCHVIGTDAMSSTVGGYVFRAKEAWARSPLLTT